MKLHYIKILLFSVLLNTLVSSSYANNKNKRYSRPDTSTITLRVLSECGVHTSIYDNDPGMNSVKENFDRQTSQRFEEYNECMKDKRQKCKEQCDKDIQKIILKDKIEKSLDEKVEKVCLRCGCGLGGVAAGVGIFGSVAVNELKKAAMAIAIAEAKEAAIIEVASQGASAGVAELITRLRTTFSIQNLGLKTLESAIDVTNYTDEAFISKAVIDEFNGSGCAPLYSVIRKPICSMVFQKNFVTGGVGGQISATENIKAAVNEFVTEAKTAATQATQTSTENVTTALITKKTEAVNATYASCQTAIIASVVAILVIVLIMVIIYLILRYRRKRKMNKKQQYTKLLNQ
ncbi:PIR protein, putative [Plasmodium sp.]|nr:PIR protein, putative [Plasmodium sp.]